MDLRDLFLDEHDRLFQYLARFTGDDDLAADVIQDAFLAAIERPPPRTDNLRGWLYTVATNRARETLRTAARRKQLLQQHGSEETAGSPTASPADHAIQRDARDTIQTALLQLSERDRIVLLMWSDGFKQREIGEAVGIPTNSVGSVLARAIRQLAARCPAEVGEQP